MSSVSKGRIAEKRCEDALKAEGWLTYRAMRGGRMYHPIDILGCIDIVAKKANSPTRWIQVKSTKANVPTSVYKELLDVPWGPQDLVELWHWVPRKGFHVVQVHPPPQEA